MSDADHLWALVLAAGEGTRLRDLTRRADNGPVPKQYCSLRGGPSLLEETLHLAANVSEAGHIMVIVAAQHRRWWMSAPSSLPAARIVVQPLNRGTANGILLQLLHLMRIDPQAQVVLLPSDHYVADEPILAQAIRTALSRLPSAPDEIVLLGMQPSFPDPDLGYITPGASDGYGTCAIAAFVEKPSAERAQQLIATGALWSAFIITACCRTLLDLYERRFPHIVQAMRLALCDETDPATHMAALYEQLPTLDFSRDLLAWANPHHFRILPVQGCGWSDLGTPERVGQTLSRFPGSHARDQRPAGEEAPANLARLYHLASPAHRPGAPSWELH